jgi:hypothetical protein
LQNRRMTPRGVNRNLKLTYHQKMIRKPHTDLHIACLPKKIESYKNNWGRPYAMAG